MKFSRDQIALWKRLISEYLFTEYQLLIEDITTPGDAWFIARSSGCMKTVYGSRDITDAHIITALKKIFPNVNWSE